ncbi:MAG: hypothetical protein HZA59_06905 [Hydrogenophilales bacterium]|nr:hypothetical protein [Hydrogenophilales bacterium]
MKKLLISSVVAVLCMGAPVIYADDTHHPEQSSAPAPKSVPGKNVMPKQPATPDKTMSSTGDSGAADAQMAKAQERMKQAQALMGKLRDTKDPAERKKLMQQHTQAMRDTMDMMRGMKMGMGMMGQGKEPGKTGGMMPMHQMMEERMGMMQMMMEQMLERQEMLMQDGK